MKKLYGYNGKIAYIDLNISKVEIKDLEPEIVENYLGDKLRAGEISKKEAQSLIIKYKNGEISRKKLLESFQGWNAYAKWANSLKLRRKMARKINLSIINSF